MQEYYQICAIPKPGAEKKKKKSNGYKDKPNRTCYYTGAPNAERHEIFGGPVRQTSIDHGFQIDVCPDIHRAFHAQNTDWAQKEMEKWRKHFQKKYEKEVIKNGIQPEQARKLWLAMIGRSYTT